MRVVAVIPARWASSRLPGKPLRDLGGRPLIQRVVEAVDEAGCVDRILVATDDDRVVRAVEGAGVAQAVLTSPDHPTGTDRIAEVMKGREEDWVLNVQGDEPFVSASALRALRRAAEEDPDSVGTLYEPVRSEDEWLDPSVVKVVTDPEGRALYFSRAPIPGRHPSSKDAAPWKGAKRHIGVYSCSRGTLLAWAGARPTPLETREGLEQLRLLESGTPIRLVESPGRSLGIDTEEQLAEAARRWAEKVRATGP